MAAAPIDSSAFMAFMAFVRAICDADSRAAVRMIRATPALATSRASEDVFLSEITHWVYRDDTALHVAAAAHRVEVVRGLIAATNRRGAQALHYACDGAPGSAAWEPPAQAAVIVALIEAGADPNAMDKSGIAPLHRAVRTRCAAAVEALLARGAHAHLANRNGSTPLDLARQTTGRGGSGSAEAKAQQTEIIRVLERVR